MKLSIFILTFFMSFSAFAEGKKACAYTKLELEAMNQKLGEVHSLIDDQNNIVNLVLYPVFIGENTLPDSLKERYRGLIEQVQGSQYSILQELESLILAKWHCAE